MIDIKELQQQPEGQLLDRKSFRIDAKALGVILVAFANADGGDVVIGIEDDGRITGISITKSLSPECDREALRVLNKMPNWEPGIQNDQPCRTKVSIPIVFKL